MTEPARTYSVAIRENATGEVRLYPARLEWTGGADEPDVYLWTDGNFGCDCNLADFFAQAGGEAEDESSPCGSERFSPLYALLPDGTRVELEGE